jgi:hypothetical protein
VVPSEVTTDHARGTPGSARTSREHRNKVIGWTIAVVAAVIAICAAIAFAIANSGSPTASGGLSNAYTPNAMRPAFVPEGAWAAGQAQHEALVYTPSAVRPAFVPEGAWAAGQAQR